ncbi:malate dehydrogenase, cytoplasmic-like isoform X2 [Rhopalosiphum maidis]|uniref:malate dehydrogenase, cytoplasmic-like isoform X2 n=1 Tax=Rhopalosiphum maidis TaxID=43146 RepID=UPI000EFE9793|nr:malate dehydrogenase, cytoplasmic-like isoform X2 [Rhopalosiphum maidis]
MNLFRLCGDMIHLLAILMLPVVIWKTQSCAGISRKTQILFAIVFTTRYTDLFIHVVSMYNSLMKIVFLTLSYITLHLMFYTFKSTYDHKNDRFRIVYLIVPSLVLSFVFVHVYTVVEIVWTYSIYLESVAIVPQLFMVPRTSQDESFISHYLFALGSYKALYLLNWIYRYYEEHYFDSIAIVAGTVETVITYFGYFSIFIRPKANNGPIRVVVTDAASQLAYSLIFKIANGDVFGTKQQVILHLVDIPSAMEILEGVCMEIEDLALPLVKGCVKTTKLEEAFKDVDAAFLLDTMPDSGSKEKKDFLSSNVKIFKLLGGALDKYAKKDVKVLVIGNSANTNALICSLHAPSIPKKNFTAMTRLAQNRVQSAIAIYLRLSVSNIKNVTIWGNQSSTQFPDVFNASVQLRDSSKSVYDTIKDTQWLEKDFIKIIQSREAAVIQAKKNSSAMSAAKAAVDHMHDWWFGTSNGTWVSMGVISDGSYGVPKDLIYSMPVTIYKKQWRIVQGLKITNFAKKKLDLTTEELLHEKEEALEICNLCCV